MRNDDALTAQEVADILGVGKNKIYELAKTEQLRSYRIGRKIRFTYRDVQAYINGSKASARAAKPMMPTGVDADAPFVICGQDIILDALSNYMTQRGVRCLRSYVGSYDSLVNLYKGEVQVASSHLWNGDTDTYNKPYVKALMPGVPAVIVHLTYRMQGFYVRKGNPKSIKVWDDIANDGVIIVNREKGAGSRVLLDEHLRLSEIDPANIKGYENEVQSHIAVASAVARERADVAVGSEKVAKQVEGIEFVPLQREDYELVFKRSDMERRPFLILMDLLESGILRDEFAGLGGYDTSDMGRISYIG